MAMQHNMSIELRLKGCAIGSVAAAHINVKILNLRLVSTTEKRDPVIFNTMQTLIISLWLYASPMSLIWLRWWNMTGYSEFRGKESIFYLTINPHYF